MITRCICPHCHEPWGYCLCGPVVSAPARAWALRLDAHCAEVVKDTQAMNILHAEADRLDPSEASSQADGHAELMKSICCVCQAHLRGPVDALVISHGLCEPCYLKQLADLVASCPL